MFKHPETFEERLEYFVNQYKFVRQICSGKELPEVSDFELLNLLYQDASKNLGLSVEKITRTRLADYVTRKILPDGLRMFNTQISRVEEKDSVIPSRLKKPILQYFSQQTQLPLLQKEQPTDSDVRTLEHFFVEDPFNRKWWCRLECTLTDYLKERSNLYSHNLIICDMEGRTLYGKENCTFGYDHFPLERLFYEGITNFEYMGSLEEKPMVKVERNSNYISNQFYSILFPWSLDGTRSNPFEEENNSLNEMLAKMKLVFCHTGIAVRELEKSGKTPQDLETIGNKEYGSFYSFVLTVLYNWCDLHRDISHFPRRV